MNVWGASTEPAPSGSAATGVTTSAGTGSAAPGTTSPNTTSPGSSAAPTSATATPTSAGDEAGGPVRGDRKKREEQAFRLYSGGRFAEAALEFEALWRDFAEVPYLYNAASSRFTVGHYAHAADYLTRYLGTAGLNASDRSDAAGQLAEAKRHLVTVQIRVEGPNNLEGATLMVDHVADLASDLRPPLRVAPSYSQGAWTATIGLDPGNWEAHLEVPGYAQVDAPFAVQSGQKIDVVLRPERASAPPKDQWRRPFALGFGIGGAVVAAAGIGVTAGEAVQTSGHLNETKCMGTTQCIDGLSSALNGRAWGAGLLGLGVGAAIGGATAVMPNDRRRRLFWITEASTGTVLTLVGIVSLAVGARSANATEQPKSAANLDGWIAGFDADGRRGATIHTTGGALLGLGVGLGGSALTGLLLTRAAGSKTRDIAVSPTVGGLVVGGRF